MMTFWYTGENCLADAAAHKDTWLAEFNRIVKALKLDPAEIPLQVSVGDNDGNVWLMYVKEGVQ